MNNRRVSTSFIFFFCLVVIFLPIRLFHITTPLHNITNFRQAQTATIALNFYKNGINLFQSELDIFGVGKEKYLTLEFPLYQAVVAILHKVFFVNDLWGRVVSVFSGFLSALFLYSIVILILKSHRLALLSSFLFLSVPLNMYHQKDFLIESFVVACLLGGFYFSLRWIEKSEGVSLIFALTLLSLGYMQKPMYGPFLLIPLSYYFIKKHSIKKILSPCFLSLILIPIVALFIWTAHLNAVNTLSGHSYFTTYNKDHLLWNIGSWEDRINSSLWDFRIRNILDGMFLKPGVVFFFLGLLFSGTLKRKDFLFVWLAGELLYFFIFFKIQSHIYYQMIITSITSIFMAQGILGSVSYFIKRVRLFDQKFLSAVMISCVLSIYLWRAFISSDWDASADKNWYQRIISVGNVVPKNSAGIFVNPGYDWNSVYTYFPKIKVLLISVEDFTLENLLKWQKEGYRYVILHDYASFDEYLTKMKMKRSFEFITSFPEVLRLSDFKVYTL